MKEIQERMDFLTEMKVNTDLYRRDEDLKRVQINMLQGRTLDNGRSIQALEGYIDRLLPLKVLDMITETLQAFLGKKEKKKLDE